MSRNEAGGLGVASESTRGVIYSSRLRSLMHLFAAAGFARELCGRNLTRAAPWRVLEAVFGAKCEVFGGVESRVPAGVWMLM